jgi:hypothetical protein
MCFLIPFFITSYAKNKRTYFRGYDSFKKCDDFIEFNESDLVVRRVLFRYVSNLEVFFINFSNCFSLYYVIC